MQLELQHEMADAIVRAAAAERLAPARIGALVQRERLTIHARTFRASLIAALGAAFPAVKRLTGEGFFTFMAAQFIGAHPPRTPIVAQYGAEFHDFIAMFEPASALPWLADVARLEWALHALSNQPAGAPLNPATLAGADDARLDWHGSARLFASRFAVADIVTAEDALPEDIGQPSWLLLRADADAVRRRKLTRAEHLFLAALAAGEPLSQAIARALGFDPAFDFVTALRVACAEGCFTNIHAI